MAKRKLDEILLEIRQTARQFRTPRGGTPAAKSADSELSICRYIKGAVTGKWRKAEAEKALYELAQKDMEEGDMESGGFLVHPDVMAGIIDILRARPIVRTLKPLIVTGIKGNSVEIPRKTEGSVGYWIGEAKHKPPSDVKGGMIEVALKKVAALVKLSNELIEDSTPAADTIVKEDIGAGLGVAEDTGLLTGNGGAAPIGLFNLPGIPRLALVAALTPEDLSLAIATMQTSNVEPTGWLTTPIVKHTLRTMKSGDNYVMLKNDISKGEPDSVMGYPVAVSTLVPAGSIVLGNWKDFVIVEKRTGLQMSVSDEAGDSFEHDQTWFRGVRRVSCTVRHPESFYIIEGV